jgi:toxin FitB
MIVADTNVISELSRQALAPEVVSSLDSLAAGDVATTAITAAELLYSVARLPDGRRKTELSAAVHGLLGDDLGGRVLPFDRLAAGRYAEVIARREQLGHPIGTADAQIAAICSAVGATLAMRNIADFVDTGIELISPWSLA